ncbi:MAG TPA: DeoR/GlpR family DNA-binding transcription regulator [Desulfobacteria bacterium]|nr:DeoR/GlpR family DNA-binding transcription regulator [Desulfobacteria bacterium]
MLTAERRKRILEFISREGRAEVAELAEYFGVSGMTIRRDLNALDANGLLERAHGGAVANGSFAREVPYRFKAISNIDLKRQIARAAAALVKDGDTLILDAGSTALEIAKQLKKQKNGLTIVTPDLKIAIELADVPGFKVLTTGGMVQCETYCCLGEEALTFLKTISVNIAFIGTPSIDLASGLYTPTLAKAHLKKAMINSANQVVIAADHTKFGRRAFSKICGFESVHSVISDNQLSSPSVAKLEQMGIKVILAQAE